MKNLLPGVPLIESPFFEQHVAELPDAYVPIARSLHEWGYAIIRFPDEGFYEKASRIRHSLAPRFDIDEWKKSKRLNLRVQDAWRYNQDVKSIACNEDILAMLAALWGRKAIPFQTLNFPVGTQQAMHTDHLFFASVPERFMCGVWVALEDIDDSNGPIFYYPRSHKFTSYSNEQLGISKVGNLDIFDGYGRYESLYGALTEQSGLQQEFGTIKQGDAVIWASNLLHGGSEHRDVERTRWSQVTHYFFEDCAYTTPLANDIYHGQFYFRVVMDIRTQKILPNIVGSEVAVEEMKRMSPAKVLENLERYYSVGHESPFSKHPDLPPDFDPIGYLQLNSDLIWGAADPYEHYIQYGAKEGRYYRF